MAVLTLMMGCPGSGKSTFIDKKIFNEQIVSRDQIRFSIVSEDEEYFSKEKEVFSEFIKKVNDGLKSGWDVCADATHLSKASRNKLIRNINAHPSKIRVIWIKTPLEECIERNKNRIGTRAYVPESVIRRMFYQTEKPEFEEGIDEIVTVENNNIIEIREVK